MASRRDERAYGEAEQTGRFDTEQLEQLVARSTQPSAMFDPSLDAATLNATTAPYPDARSAGVLAKSPAVLVPSDAEPPVPRPQRRIVVRTEAGRRLVWRPVARPDPGGHR